ncbi:hypothetical protein ACF0H5_018621 [Mactra antiquata]
MNPQILIAWFFVPVSVYCTVKIKIPQIEIGYNVTYFNRSQGNTFRIQTYFGVSVSDCVIECALRPHCKVLDYHTEMKFCQLYTKTELQFTKNKCTYIRREDISITKYPCGKDCEIGEVCDIGTKTCVIKECMEFPIIRNGDILGNQRQVGSKLSVKCRNNSRPVNGKRQSVCSSDGVWRPIIQCQVKGCGNLEVHDTVTVKQNNGSDEGSVIEFACKPGYGNIFDSMTRVCGSDGTWNASTPQCLKKICVGAFCYLEYVHANSDGRRLGAYVTSDPESGITLCQDTYQSFQSAVFSLDGICHCKEGGSDTLYHDESETTYLRILH